ncbi:hypothetical protein F8388_020215 [Cannabis sativa]|uniref:Uncharacterized protein n=1 Tax=Cannabis sativa TaxID=3483 RepID=A0A7J6FVB7_CANSA|nr:hypothetical protein F8388_020215 [Cannabis sativa]
MQQLNGGADRIKSEDTHGDRAPYPMLTINFNPCKAPKLIITMHPLPRQESHLKRHRFCYRIKPQHLRFNSHFYSTRSFHNCLVHRIHLTNIRHCPSYCHRRRRFQARNLISVSVKRVMIVEALYPKEQRTAGVRELGPLDEKVATRGDVHLPITVFGELSIAVGDLHSRGGQAIKESTNFNLDERSHDEASVESSAMRSEYVMPTKPWLCLPVSPIDWP